MWLFVIITAGIVAVFYMIRNNKENKSAIKSSLNDRTINPWRYNDIKTLVHKENIHLPAIFVEMNAFDENTRRLLDMVRGTGKTLRIATKSIRCPFLIKRIRELGPDVVKGFMCYSVQEAAMLAKEGLDDFYIPYPTLQTTDIKLALELQKQGITLTLTIDSLDHIKHLTEIYDKLCNETKEDLPKLMVSIDLDLSFKLLGDRFHLGAHRSKIDSVIKFAVIAEALEKNPHIFLTGVMGYEAHVAGLPDDNPFAPFPNVLFRLMKHLFYRRTLNLRGQVSSYCKAKGIQLTFFNGGGTGNLKDAAKDPAITEVTAGSGFLQAQLFDYYKDNTCYPAICFALQATRINKDYIVCQSGGFIASGSCSMDKFPKPFGNPLKLQPYADEGFGEVQTPLSILGHDARIPGDIQLSDPVLFRPAKSGEISEHFTDYILLRNGEIVDKVKTYRGFGHVFY